MTQHSIDTVGVIGSGIMGAGIAEVCARAGHVVEVFDVDSDKANAGRQRIERSLARAASSGKITHEDKESALSRIAVNADLNRLAPCDIVIEAATEHEPTKLDIFRRLDQVVTSDQAILASNTSSIPIMKIAMATSCPTRVIGIHFFNPVPVLRLVEIVPSLLTGHDTVDRATCFVQDGLGKQAIRSQDRAGFTVNSLLVPYRPRCHTHARLRIRIRNRHRRWDGAWLRPPPWAHCVSRT